MQQHVGFVDSLEPANRGAVEAVARHEAFLGELLDGDGEVLHQPGKVAEPKVDDLRATLLRECRTSEVFQACPLLMMIGIVLPAVRRSCDRLVVGVDGLGEDRRGR